ncbi:3-dehydroquinate dehydratase [Rhodothalassium salexigens DSM 2132]|uniref:3-dehydroquinate dehydratase n=1 Tax=Rhodothalassium salexigens DSM 2132 TaxID=1188247 RepID=A0A4R2PS14_RHOSA|nr:type II 3-dehydroquinate dehydratase [Rhodothalassium salexigens]MBK1639737.1 type II 3-dehydroquinate dehydratase [Rhodothalassium salexigens DSM 2132]TCP37864.1 3-dehydroquinate dehydratase [Rhodothalassium salexigens DSM 2132]
MSPPQPTATSPRFFVLNGPNLNLLGTREPSVYGHDDLAALDARCHACAERLGMTVECRQSNHEGVLVDWIHEAGRRAAGLVLNAAAYTHTSVALRDALAAVDLPAIEVHLSNIHAREPFRHRSMIAPCTIGTIAGFGPLGYELALTALVERLQATAGAPPAGAPSPRSPSHPNPSDG